MVAISKQTRKLLDERKQMIARLSHPHYNGEGLGDYPCEMCGFPRNHAIHTQPIENTRICRKA